MWTEIDFICKNLILDGLTDELYDYYCTMATIKEVWDMLQKNRGSGVKEVRCQSILTISND